jgi:hypothetical protein
VFAFSSCADTMLSLPLRQIQPYESSWEHRDMAECEKTAYTSLPRKVQCLWLVRNYGRAFDILLTVPFVYDAAKETWVANVWDPATNDLMPDQLLSVGRLHPDAVVNRTTV